MRTITYVRPRPHPRSMIEPLLLSLLMGLALFFVALLFAVVSFEISFAGRIYPGVSIAGVDVGGMSPSQAQASISQKFTFPQQGHILFHYQNQSWLATPAQLGLLLNPESTAAFAYQIGRTGSPFQRAADQLGSWYAGRQVSGAFIYDQRMAYQYLSTIAAKIDQQTIEANVGVNGINVVVRSGQVGRMLDIPATLSLLTSQIADQKDGVVALAVKETPPVVVDVSEQADLARTILSQPLTISLPAGQPDKLGPWIIDQPTLANLLTFNKVQDAPGAQAAHYQINLKSDALRTYLTNLAATVQTSPQNAQFTFNDQTRQLDLLQPSVTGRTLDVEKTLKSIEDKVIQGNHNIPLELDLTQPRVNDKATAAQLGISEMIQSYTSYFYGSPPERVQNIKAAASRFHGVLVAPGETFSMGQTLGDISLDNGYAEALIIVGGKTIAGVGGGVCQVSTTLFRTAFFAGFPVVDRTPHAYRVKYYEQTPDDRNNPGLAGLDATVFEPLVDFQFTNNTSHWLLMDTFLDAAHYNLTWKFYSTSDGRTVNYTTTGPVNIVPAPPPVYTENDALANGQIKQTDWAADGADVTVNRTVSRNGSVLFQDQFLTHYEPWAAKYDYGPGTDVPTPAPTP
ncbi:MAG: VanW family protein [Anaerolineaceae bacterium]|nr:VanW family protein [Anaerolineaceae bacterium]